MFDTFHTPDGTSIYGITQTCEWINDKMEEWGDKATWHVGNHDCAYLASYNKDYTKTRHSEYYYCSGWSRSKAKTFNKEIDPKWMQGLKLCTLVGNYVVSHAGFHYDHFLPLKSELDNIRDLYDKWETDKAEFMHKPWHWIWDVGACRGGMSKVGSPVWLDWYEEFVPLDNIGQVVGHSTKFGKHDPILKQGGFNNYNIDCMQHGYAVWENGVMEAKILEEKDFINYLKV